MDVLYNRFNQIESPNLVLCNPNRAELYSLNTSREIKLTLKYNALSELSLIIDKKINGEDNPAYDYVQAKRVVLLEGFGYFILEDPQEDLSSPTPFKNVLAYSLEYELVYKNITAFGGTYKFYDPISPTGTLLDLVLKTFAPTWTVGQVDSSLWNTYRTFDISSSNVYNFLMTDVETAYNCVFIFDTYNKTLSAKATSNATTQTDIFISKENLIDSASMREISSEIATVLSVYGGGDLNIRGVNPLGTNYIYNFSYYKNEGWMSSSLVSALTSWENLVSSNQATYSALLTSLFEYNEDLIALNGELAELNSEYLVLEGIQKVRIELQQAYADILSQMNAKQLEINSKENEITNKEAQIVSTQSSIQAIITLLSFEQNFNTGQLAELRSFMFENSYQNKNIIKTDLMTIPEIQVQSQALYNDAQSALEKTCVPRYEFEIETANFVSLKEYEKFTQQLELGCVVTINAKDDVMVESVLLEIHLNFTNPTDFKLTFSNRLRLDNGSFIFSDLFGQNSKTASSVDFNNLNWGSFEQNYKDEVTGFISSSLDASLNNVVNASNQEILINQNGLRGKRLIPETQTYSPNQVWLTSNTLAFTKDNWNTASMAVGQITYNSQQVYGVVAEAIVGKIIAGNQLTISNQNNNFIVDSNGATLNNAKFTIATTNTKVFIDPTALKPFVIQQNVGGTFTDRFFVDSGGNVNMTGTITANAGSLGGWSISLNGISDPYGNYIRSDGNIKLGGLTISGSSATFTGDIYANRLIGAVSYTQLTDIPADKITSGSMSGNRIYGGTPYPYSMGLSSGLLNIYPSGNFAVIDANGSNRLRLIGAGSSYLDIYSTSGLFSGTFAISGGDFSLSGTSGVLTPNGYGVNSTLTVLIPGGGSRTLRFSRGICYATS